MVIAVCVLDSILEAVVCYCRWNDSIIAEVSTERCVDTLLQSYKLLHIFSHDLDTSCVRKCHVCK